MALVSLVRLPISQLLYNQHAGANPDLFDTVGGIYFLLLYCQPDEYKPIVTDLSDLGTDGLLVGAATVQAVRIRRLEGFEISTVEARQAAVQVLRALERAAFANPGQFNPVLVYDGHCLQEDRPIQEINGSVFVRREMRILSLTGTGGSFQDGLTTYSSGFTLRCVDVAPR